MLLPRRPQLLCSNASFSADVTDNIDKRIRDDVLTRLDAAPSIKCALGAADHTPGHWQQPLTRSSDVECSSKILPRSSKKYVSKQCADTLSISGSQADSTLLRKVVQHRSDPAIGSQLRYHHCELNLQLTSKSELLLTFSFNDYGYM